MKIYFEMVAFVLVLSVGFLSFGYLVNHSEPMKKGIVKVVKY